MVEMAVFQIPAESWLERGGDNCDINAINIDPNLFLVLNYNIIGNIVQRPDGSLILTGTLEKLNTL